LQLQVNRTGHDARFDLPPEEVPYGSIALALFLTVFGATAFVLAWLHFTQQIFGKEQAVRQLMVYIAYAVFTPDAHSNIQQLHVWCGSRTSAVDVSL
jgi:hypothetical protein